MSEIDEGALAVEELSDVRDAESRATKWAADETALLDAEERARADVILPLCEATWSLENGRGAIAHEKANPSGVVDLNQLHAAGEEVQNAQASIAALKPRYAAFRHHAFSAWQSEGVCVAASEAAN